MLDETTTTASTEESTAEVTTSQAESTTDSPAEAQETQTQTDPQGESESAPVVDEDLEWLKAKGIDPSDPQFTSKVAKSYREAERAMHETKQEAAKSLQDGLEQGEYQQDPEVTQLKRDVAEMRFYRTNPEAEGREDDIIAAGKDYPELAAAFNLSALWEIAQGRSAGQALKGAKREGREEAKQEIAKASTAGTPSGNASVKKAEKSQDDERLERFSNW